MERQEDFIKSLSPRYQKAHISTVKGWDLQMGTIKAWIENPKNFLILIGGVGVGKTYVATAIALYLFEIKIKKSKSNYLDIEFVRVREFFNFLKKCYSKGGDDIGPRESLSKTEWLILDDLGASRNTEWQQEIILDIIDERYNNEKPTIITTNYSFKELGDVFGLRVQSRLEASENCIIEKWDRDLRQEGM